MMKTKSIKNMTDFQTPSHESAVNHAAYGVTHRKINILFVIDWLHEFGGTEKHLHQLVRYLDKSKFQCHLIALNGNREFIAQFFEDYGCKFVPIHIKRIYTLPALAKAREMARYLQKARIDIVQTFGMGADNYATIIARFAKVPVVISSRRDMGTYRTGLYRLADRLSDRFIHEYIAVCDRVGEVMQRKGIEKMRITRLYNGIELDKWLSVQPVNIAKRKQLGIAEDAFVIGNVSHFRPEKGHRYFFEAIRRLSKRIPNLKVFALGAPGPNREEIEQTVANDPILRKCVTITHTREIEDYLSVFDVACLTPISNEGFSNALLEEMAAGLPIVATDVGGNAEAIFNGESGLIIPPGDANAIYQAIYRLYESPELRLRLGENARKRAIEHFNLQLMVSKYEQYYQNLLDKQVNDKK
jgi:glycosyltransferase involved in cell wall biosynthesis